MKISFRTDSSLVIGSGHVMRCLTLANSLRAGGADCRFICRDYDGDLIDKIQNEGFTVSRLPKSINVPRHNETTEYTGWLGVDLQTDARQTISCIKLFQPDWLIVDHYSLDVCWEQMVRPFCRRIMVIDDLADRSHDCDLLLDQNLDSVFKGYRQLVTTSSRLILGPEYALLRPEFADYRERSLQRRLRPAVRKLLISMGGMDRVGATQQILKALKNCSLPVSIEVCVVVGYDSSDIRHIRLEADKLQRAVDVLSDVRNLAELMTHSDLAIGAVGSTAWERCCLGLPTVAVVLANNQYKVAAALNKYGCIKLIDKVSDIAGALPLIFQSISSSATLEELSRNSSVIVDGLGTSRVTRMLENWQE